MQTDQSVKKRAEAAFEWQSQHLHLWQEAVSFCLPRKAWIRGTPSTPYAPNPKLQSGVATAAIRDLASGMLTAFMNSSEIWAKWEPADELPPQNKTTRLEDWFLNASRVAMRQFSPAGVYDRVFELLLDACATGTAAIQIEGPLPGNDSPLNIKTWDIGSYAIAENSVGIVDRVWREIEYTAQQASDMWPEYKPKRWKGMKLEDLINKRECYILEIVPRDEKDVKAGKGPLSMPYKGTIVHKETSEVTWEGGWDEMPVLVYRFMRQSGCNPWGVGPGVEAVPDMRSLNFLETAIADGYGKMVDPPMAYPDDMRGILDLTMGGTNALSDMSRIPQPLFQMSQGIGQAMQFIQRLETRVEEHFFKSLFTPFLNDQRTLKAAQVYEMKSDQLNVFAPFGHKFLGFVDMFLERVFMVLVRQGLFGPIPQEAVVGGKKFLYPKVAHQSRMALELQNLGRAQVRQLLADIVPVANIDPSSLDWVNFPQVMRLLGANDVVMPNILNTPEQYALIQQSKQQAMQQQQALQFAAQFATKNPDHAAAAASLAGG